MNKPLISSTPQWSNIKAQVNVDFSLRKAFADNANRSNEMRRSCGDWTMDFSRQLLDGGTLKLLLELAKAAGIEKAKEDMFRGVRINTTENRSVLHTALRSPSNVKLQVDNKDIVKDVQNEIDKMSAFTHKILSGELTGYTGKKIRHVISIGIGGSNLGPEMACKALLPYSTDLDVIFVSNIDPTDITLALRKVRAEETLFIISSKTFTTSETMQNATCARDWCVEKLKSEEAVGKHFVAVSTNEKLVREFGIRPENMFVFWDWVGGRFSMSSAIGLPVMLAVGPEHYTELLKGFYAVDEHYLNSPIESNVPILLAVLNLWNTTFLGMQTHAVVAYDEYLALLPDHLQQLVMESLGKRVTEDGRPVDYPTCPVFFGGVGTNVQHSYFQLLHQGNGLSVPVDFIAFTESLNPAGNQHRDLFLNMVAQANVMAFGETEDELAAMGNKPELLPHQVIPGNKPSTVLICKKLNPNTLGQLIAVYEHMVHAWGTILGINAFDQFGVEAGKRTAKKLGTRLSGFLTVDAALKLLSAG